MDEYLENNKALWNEITPIHLMSEFYDVEGFKSGRCALKSIELEEMGDVSGKSLLHLQCHFGLDTLSWGRLGAKVTGTDFSEESIKTARQLSRETGIRADFICSDIYALPEVLKGEFDIVFTSYGVLAWISDLKKWAEIIAWFLKSGGFFYIAEIHPFLGIFDDTPNSTELRVRLPYFRRDEPMRFEPQGDYAEPGLLVTKPSFEWPYPLSEIICSLTTAGLTIEYLHEFPGCCYKSLPFMIQGDDGWWHLEGDRIPLSFSLKATKPHA